MKRIVLSILAILVVLGLGSILQPSVVYAQAGGNGSYNSTQGSMQNNGVGNNVTNNTTDTSSAGTSTFDWRWLLPLLAIPVIYFIWKSASTPEEDMSQYKFRQPALGVKGGRTGGKKSRKV